jgi:hypothetical protein
MRGWTFASFSAEEAYLDRFARWSCDLQIRWSDIQLEVTMNLLTDCFEPPGEDRLDPIPPSSRKLESLRNSAYDGPQFK